MNVSMADRGYYMNFEAFEKRGSLSIVGVKKDKKSKEQVMKRVK